MAVIGIDLGTTNSVCGYYDAQGVRILRSERIDGLVPSVVCLRLPAGPDKEPELLVGQDALDYAYKNPENAVFSIKRLMGRSHNEEDVAKTEKRVSYSIKPAKDGEDSGVRVTLDGKEYTPEEISAQILQKIKLSAERELRQKVTEAVISVPAYFEDRQRAATRKAAELAGLTVRQILDEPSAAAVAYGFDLSKAEGKTLLVFDLGGGTFDVSIIALATDKKGMKYFDVLEKTGDRFLGGDDFDQKIVDQIISWVKQKHKIDLSETDSPESRKFRLLAKMAAEGAKIALSEKSETEVNLPVAYATAEGQMIDVHMKLTRAQFEELIRPDVERCMECVNEALKNEDKLPDDIDEVLLVGGSTMVPLVYKSVVELFGEGKVKRENPYHAVALGAGIVAGISRGLRCSVEECRHINITSETRCAKCGASLEAAEPTGELLLNQTTPMPFGVRAVKGDQRDVFQEIIPKGTLLPMDRMYSEQFFTTVDNFVSIRVYEGTSPRASENDLQCLIELTEEDFKKADWNAPVGTEIAVSIRIDSDGVIEANVNVPRTTIGKTEFVRRNRNWVEGDDDPEAFDRLKDDLEGLIGASELFRRKYLSFMAQKEERRLSGDIGNAKEALQSNNPARCRAALKNLMVSFDACGTASLIFLAERLQTGAQAENSEMLRKSVNEIKGMWNRGDMGGMEELKSKLRPVISSELIARYGPRGDGLPIKYL
ncbi:MAG: Hsp70 family protein [Chloroflexi bacterium]|nr:Hsp70 family protein [Chloroflexota bacterium]